MRLYGLRIRKKDTWDKFKVYMWEVIPTINDECTCYSHRLKVPGGWLVRSYLKSSYPQAASCFIQTHFVQEIMSGF